jgi:hypothetical protein
MNFTLKHFKEWLNSCVDPEIINLNVQPLSGTTPYEYLLYGLPESDRRNDGRLRDYWIEKYRHIEEGGWWCSGIDLLTGEDSLWGGFKPNRPRTSEKFRDFGQPQKTKVIKYEHPPKVPTEIFALKVPQHIWDKIASRVGLKRYHSPLALRLTARRKPITFWEWLLKNPQIPLVITEGAKKAGALLTAGYVAIALPGIFNGYRQEKDSFGNKIGLPRLIPQLEVLAEGGREISFCFDRDIKPTAAKNVRLAIKRTGQLLKRKGCNVKIITWDNPQKGVDDLIAALGAEYFDAVYENRLSLEEFNLIEFFHLTPDLRISEQFFPDSLTIPDSAQLIGLKGYQKTGKTEWLAKRIEPALNQGKRVIVIGHREQLMIELARRFGVDYRTEIGTSQMKGLLGYALCIDSLHGRANPPFNPTDWEESIVIIDEVEQVLWHLLNGNTCTRNRVNILKCFKELLQTVASTGGQIYVADADLSPISINYLKAIIGFKIASYLVENTYRPNFEALRKCYHFGGSTPSGLVTRLVERLSRGEKAFILTDGQKHKSKWGTRSLEYYLQKKFPDLKILRIDRESISDPKHPAYCCIGKLNQILSGYDIVICSPTMETGVSIDLKHFDGVWAIAHGVQTIDAVCQGLERVRDDVPRYLWAKQFSPEKIGKGETEIKPLLATTHKLCQVNMGLLRKAGVNESYDLLFYEQENDSHETPSLWAWAKRACVINSQNSNYLKNILKKLELMGYELQEVLEDEEDSQIISDEVKSSQKILYSEHCSEVSLTSNPSDGEYEELKEKRSRTEKELIKVKKGSLCRRYLTEDISPDMVKRDDDGWYRSLELHYYLTVDQEFLTQRERRSLKQMLEPGHGVVFKPDFNSQLLSPSIEALRLIDIEQFLAGERVFTSSELGEWLERLIGWRHEIKAILGMSVNPDRDTPIGVAQRLLGLLDLKMTLVERRREGGKITRFYRMETPDPDGRQAIFERWRERDRAACCCDTPSININDLGGVNAA